MRECSVQDRDAPQPRQGGGGGGLLLLGTAPDWFANDPSPVEGVGSVEQMTTVVTCGVMTASRLFGDDLTPSWCLCVLGLHVLWMHMLVLIVLYGSSFLNILSSIPLNCYGVGCNQAFRPAGGRALPAQPFSDVILNTPHHVLIQSQNTCTSSSA